MTIRYDETARNVMGGELEPCSLDPVTGFFRNGCCETGPEDVGQHTVCAVMTEAFLSFSLAADATICLPRAPNTTFPASVRVIAGACAPPAGKRRSTPASPRRLSLPPPPKRSSPSPPSAS